MGGITRFGFKLALGIGCLFAASAGMAATEMTFIMCGELREADQKVVDDFKVANPDVDIEIQSIPWGECQDKATKLAATGDPVSLAYMGSRTLKQLAKNDLIVPVEIAANIQKTYQPGILDTVRSQGKLWGFPHAFSTKTLFVNCDILTEAGLPCKGPRTWDEMFKMAKTIKDKTGIAGVGLVAKDFDNTMHQFLNYLYSNGGQVIDPVSNKITFNSKQAVETLEFYGKLVSVAQEGPTAFERDQVRDLFNDRKVAMYINGPWAGDQHNEDINDRNFRLPAGPSGSSGTLLITDSIAIFKGTGHEDLATKLGQALASGDAQYNLDSEWGLTPILQYEKIRNDDLYYVGDAYWEPFVSSIGDGSPEPLFVEYKQLQTVFNEMIQSIVLGEGNAKDLVAEATARLEEIK